MDEAQILSEAEDAFWAVIARANPQVKTGDLPPDAVFRFRQACKDVYRLWLDINDDTRPES